MINGSLRYYSKVDEYGKQNLEKSKEIEQPFSALLW